MQRVDQPIILTGYAALNKLLGREVYTSHMQLGGPKVLRSFLTFCNMISTSCFPNIGTAASVHRWVSACSKQWRLTRWTCAMHP